MPKYGGQTTPGGGSGNPNNPSGNAPTKHDHGANLPSPGASSRTKGIGKGIGGSHSSGHNPY
jgi:hypothetical protein